MSNEGGSCQIDTRQVERLFNRLDIKKQHRVLRKALQKSGMFLKREIKKTLRSRLGRKANHKSTKWNRTLASGVKAKQKNTTNRFGQKTPWEKVHIMGEFRLKFFEKGTDIRHTKRGKSRGLMSRKYYFFKDTKEQHASEAVNKLSENVGTILDSIYRSN